MAISKVGTFGFGFNVTAGATTCSVNYTTLTLGDLVIITSTCVTTTTSIQSISGGGVTTWQQSTAGSGVSLWYGRVTSVGSVTATATLTAASGGNVSLGAMQFTNATGAGTVWTRETFSNPASVAASTTLTFSSMTGLAAGNLWYGYVAPANVGSVGSTANFTYQREGTAASPDFWSNIIAYRVVTASGAVTAPTATQNTSGTYVRTGVIFSAAAGASGPTTRGQHFPFLAHHKQERPGELWKPELKEIIRPQRRSRRIIDLATLKG